MGGGRRSPVAGDGGRRRAASAKIGARAHTMKDTVGGAWRASPPKHYTARHLDTTLSRSTPRAERKSWGETKELHCAAASRGSTKGTREGIRGGGAAGRRASPAACCRMVAAAAQKVLGSTLRCRSSSGLFLPSASSKGMYTLSCSQQRGKNNFGICSALYSALQKGGRGRHGCGRAGGRVPRLVVWGGGSCVGVGGSEGHAPPSPPSARPHLTTQVVHEAVRK